MTGSSPAAGQASAVEHEPSRLYVYAIVSAESYAPTTTGIDGSALHMVGDANGPRAVVHTHSGGPYDGPDDDVKRWILEHSEVIEDGWKGAGSVLPVSFNVIVRPDIDSGASATAQLERWLQATSSSLSERLEELGGTSELRVEIALDRSAFLDGNEEIRSIRTDMAERPAGVRRLLEKRLEKTEKELADRAADDLYPAVRARIAEQCLAIEEYRTPARNAGQTPILTASCLVTEPGIQNLGAELTAIQNELPDTEIRFLGPWPPYSFADMSDSVAEMSGPEAQQRESQEST
ncbi:gas vesicle protein GvpL [Brevibacterium antiquum]|uniref:GvpL/GvpF family gas vesicle protein n=1 Tax=Brevibacterium antiquum TaxID=234835 RepID=UPI0018DF3B85|nr:GvpL/GvpF family gas vesicle protein [Brevibacterium antiquum]